MAKKTLSNFLNNYSSNPDLHKATWKQGGVDFTDFLENPNDYYAANTGAVPGMIYYADTEKFAKKHYEKIEESMLDFDQETGSTTLHNAIRSGNKLNFMSWFAWENMAFELINYLEEITH